MRIDIVSTQKPILLPAGDYISPQTNTNPSPMTALVEATTQSPIADSFAETVKMILFVLVVFYAQLSNEAERA